MALTLAATPLGNPLDASPRLKAAIENAEIIAAEDSRRFHRLASDIGATFTAKVLSFFEGNETDRTQELLIALREGRNVVVLSDAGMPTISDPGFRLMRDAIAEKLEVHVIPGQVLQRWRSLSAVFLPIDLPLRDLHLEQQVLASPSYENLRFEERTMVVFEAPHRLLDSLNDAASILGGLRLGAICREMTKTYEETIRGTLDELIEWASSNEVLGEITLVFAGVEVGTHQMTSAEMVAKVREYENAGMDRKEAISTVAKELDLPKKLVYAAVVEDKKSN